ncbi:MAG TPA: TetR/AcrR family transcriptional regulator [Sporichthya sp.]|nr:TetR/AcrR family transcriptional regulator [Sporichthya sp.]
MTQPARTYRGQTAEERQEERRQRLLDAATEIWGTQGWAAVTMRGVCAKAGLIDRYFYENFADRDALLVAVWDGVQAESLAILGAAFEQAGDDPPTEQVRAGITALVESMVADRVRAHIALGDHAGSTLLQDRRREVILLISDLIIGLWRPWARPEVTDDEMRMWALVGIGGLYELVSAWHVGVVEASAEQLIDQASEIGAVMVGHFLPE